LKRKRRLLETASISQSEVDRQAIEAKSRETAVQAQHNALALMESQKDLIDAKIEATRAQLEMARLKLEKTTIKAPFDGRVTFESAEEGEFAPIGQKLASIFDISAMEIKVNLSARKMGHLEMMAKFNDFKDVMKDVNKINELIKKHGPLAKVTYQWSDKERIWTGKVSRMTGQLDVATRTIPLVVEVKDPFKGTIPGKSPPLVPGMFVDVALQGKMYKDVIRVPRSAIHEDSVYVAKNGHLDIRKVQMVMQERDHVLVSKGLAEGELIILSPIPTPIPDMAVRVAENEKSPAQNIEGVK
jgi:RND family efflux transporter MFP subunit